MILNTHPDNRKDMVKAISEHMFANYAWDWFEKFKVPKLRPGTAMNCRLIIRKHLVPFFGEMRLEEITTMDIQAFTISIPIWPIHPCDAWVLFCMVSSNQPLRMDCARRTPPAASV